MSIEEIESTIQMPQGLLEIEVEQDWNGRKLQPNGKKLVTHNMNTVITQAQTFIHNQQESKPTPMGSRVCDHGNVDIYSNIDTEDSKEIGVEVKGENEDKSVSFSASASVSQDESGETKGELETRISISW